MLQKSHPLYYPKCFLLSESLEQFRFQLPTLSLDGTTRNKRLKIYLFTFTTASVISMCANIRISEICSEILTVFGLYNKVPNGPLQSTRSPTFQSLMN